MRVDGTAAERPDPLAFPRDLWDKGAAMNPLLRLALFPVNLVQGALIMAWTGVMVGIAVVVAKVNGHARNALALARRPWAPVVLALAGQRIISVEGIGEVDWSRPYFVTSNHQSYLDIPVLFRVLPTNLRFVAKHELKRLPFVSQYVDAMDMVWVDRTSPAAAQKSIQAVGRAVAEGRTVLLFPEGTRSSERRVARFKTGILSAAIGSGVDVLPVAIVGTERSMPRGFFLRPGTVRVRVGRPLSTDDLGAGDRRALAETARKAVAELHAGLQRSQDVP